MQNWNVTSNVAATTSTNSASNVSVLQNKRASPNQRMAASKVVSEAELVNTTWYMILPGARVKAPTRTSAVQNMRFICFRWPLMSPLRIFDTPTNQNEDLWYHRWSVPWKIKSTITFLIYAAVIRSHFDELCIEILHVHDFQNRFAVPWCRKKQKTKNESIDRKKCHSKRTIDRNFDTILHTPKLWYIATNSL